MTPLLERFEIESEIGRGAMGVVYRGRDAKINRVVAIKTISLLEQNPEEEKEFRERFFIEAQAAGSLSHPGIVTIFDVGEEPASNAPYIVMEYVQGRPLSKLLNASADRKLPLGASLQLVQEIAEALHYAHACGVIHRDIKPANILITREGHAKIADFGIAKINDSQMTMPGRTLGSPAYMAPEQLTGAPADGRSDLFSLGVILYTILTGHRPFQGNSATTVMFKVASHDPLPVTALESGFPPALNRIVSRAIAKDPTERYQTGAELAADLQELRVSQNLLHDTAASLSALGVEATTPISVRPGQHLPFQPTAMLPMVPEAPASNSQSIFHRVSYLKGTLVVAVWVLVAVAMWYRYPSRPRHKLASAETSSVPISTPQTAPREHLAGSPVPAQPVKEKHIFAAAPLPIRSPLHSKIKTPTLVALQQPAPAEYADLDVEIRHGFVVALVTVWSDETMIYEKELEGTTKKHALVFERTEGLDAATVKVPAGAHTFKVHVQSGSESYDLSKTITGTLALGHTSKLLVTCDRRRGLLLLALQ